MRFVKLSLVIAALALFALACGETSTNTSQTTNGARQTPTASPAASANTSPANTSPSPMNELAAARTTYSQVCTACHGEAGEGGTVTLEGKKLKVPSLKAGHALNHTDEQLAHKIREGGDGMPAFKERLKPEQINDLVRFVRQEFQGGTTGSTKQPAPQD